MPVGKDTARLTKKVVFDVKGRTTAAGGTDAQEERDRFLTIAPALPILPVAPVPPKLKRPCNSFSTTGTAVYPENVEADGCNAVMLQWTGEGRTTVAMRTPAHREKNPDRICLDRRGLTTFPTIVGEPKLRLMSLQHNLLTKLESHSFVQLTKLVFLDLYDNQIERLCNLDLLENLRVLLIGKNRIKRIEGLKQLSKLEVLDLHGNQILQISGLNGLTSLKVLNLAGNNVKLIGCNDFQGLTSLKELNLRRNKIKKLLGFGETPQLQKLYLSNNDIQKIEDMGSLAKSLQIKELTIDGNPVTLNSEYVSFLVSYLPNLQFLSTMQISEQIRRNAMAWRTTKEQSSPAFLDLSSQICMNVRREEAISNAKTHWDILRVRNKSFLSTNSNHKNNTNHDKKISKTKNANIDALHCMQDLSKFSAGKLRNLENARSKGFGSLTSVSENVEARKIHIKKRSNSSDNLFVPEDTDKQYPLEFKLPPILDSIIDTLTNGKTAERSSRIGESSDLSETTALCKSTESDSDSSESHESLKSGLRCHLVAGRTSSMDSERTFVDAATKTKSTSEEIEDEATAEGSMECKYNYALEEREETNRMSKAKATKSLQYDQNDRTTDRNRPKSDISTSGYCSSSSKTNSVDSCKSLLNESGNSSKGKAIVQKISTDCEKNKCRIKSAQPKKTAYYRSNRAATARAKYRTLLPQPSTFVSPQKSPPREREQGGDYLIEIVGRSLNIYGQSALRYIDRSWDSSKARDVSVVKFNYVHFNSVTIVLSKLKNRFPNAEHFIFKETNISYLGQLNALAEVQGLNSIYVESEGNPIVSKENWRTYAIFRLAHWGLRQINGKEITDEEIELANREYAGLVDIVMRSLPESLLQPLLQRLHLDNVRSHNGEKTTAKRFLFNSDPALRNVVAKEALQWRKESVTQEDLIRRHKGKVHLINVINFTVNAIKKLQMLEKEWPNILHEIVYTTLSDFSEMDTYMKQCKAILETEKRTG